MLKLHAPFLLVSLLLAPLSAPAPLPDSAEVAQTRAVLVALRDDFVRATARTDIPCAVPLAPPTIVLEDIPAYAHYEPITNTLTTSSWEQMPAAGQAIFYQLNGPGTSDDEARLAFEASAHHWSLLHELGHWWQACRRAQETGDHYARELQADRIAAAYWQAHDPAVDQHQRTLAGTIARRWPNPLPPGQQLAEWFNANYDKLALTPAARWYEARIALAALAETPAPTFAQALEQTR